ncbi:MAG: phage protease [Paracoccus sp. (in: a-proteobacteria)]|nr:phage protease [Paracoccus sp. (in: a-proteobacteria)]
MNTPAPSLALMQVMPVPPAADGEVPDWIHLLPAPGPVETNDGRGPYRLEDAPRVIAASLAAVRKLPIDENHSIDLAAPRGEPAPARGHVVELQARADGIWGRVEWTGSGRALMADRAYLGISPAILHDKSGRIVALLRASLVNRPNLRGLTALHQEETMSLNERLAEILGQEPGVDDDTLIARVTALHQQADRSAPETVALQSQIAEIGLALGVPQDAAPADILGAARRAAGGEAQVITALQSELASVTTQLNGLQEAHARERAEAYVDGQITRGRVGIKPRRDYYVGLHMRNAAEAVDVIEALPIMQPGASMAAPDLTTALNSEDPNAIIAAARGYQKKMAESGVDIDWPSAVTAIREGRT